MNFFGISVLIPTYGRTKVLSEAINCFLLQTYKGPKELIVFNDRADQVIECDAENVKIINFDKRFVNVGTKRNALMAEAKHDFVCHWDDDDIYLPERLNRAVGLYHNYINVRGSREPHCFQTNNGVDLFVRDGGNLWCTMMEKKALIEIGGFGNIDMGEDIELMNRVAYKGWIHAESSYPGMPSFIYRRGGTPYSHMVDSGAPFKFDSTKFSKEELDTSNEHVHTFIASETEKKVAAGAEPTGIINIEPKWNDDYIAMAKSAWAAYLAGDKKIKVHRGWTTSQYM